MLTYIFTSDLNAFSCQVFNAEYDVALETEVVRSQDHAAQGARVVGDVK